jgi:nucleoside-diphosphate-sugar epimerase
LLGYEPKKSIREGLEIAFEWYRRRHHFSYST